MDELKHKDDFGKSLSKSKLEMPFSDFEDSVMQAIEVKELSKSRKNKTLKLVYFFFALGSICGIVLSVLVNSLNEPILGLNPKMIAMLFQITFITLFFTQLERVLKMRKEGI